MLQDEEAEEGINKKITAEIGGKPKKVGSKPERCESVYKRTAEAQRDLFRKRSRDGMGER